MNKRRNLLSEEELRIATKSKYLTSDEEALKLFFEDCQLRNLRPDTLKFYREKLKPFDRPIIEMAERDIKNMIVSMQDRKLKTTTINTKLRAFRSLFNFLYKNKHIKNNPIANIKLLKERKQVVNTFTKEQLTELFSLCDQKTFVGLRDYTIMLLMLDTGIRLNELVGIKVDDIKDDAILITETKTYFERLLPISKKMKEQLTIYVKIRGRANTDKLFINQDGGEFKRRSLQTRMTIYSGQSGITDVRVSCHTFRHTFARMFIENGGSAFHLQAQLGHSSMEITKKYVNLFATDRAESHQKYSPLNNF